MTQHFEPVGWLIDGDTEHVRMLLGSDWQSTKMGGSNKLVVTLLDAQEAVYQATTKERERWETYISKARAQSELVEGPNGPAILMPYWVMRGPNSPEKTP